MKPQGKTKIKWSSGFAYAIGLLATDGNLSKDKRHISLTSKDLEQIENFQKALNIKQAIGKKSSGSCREKKYYFIQIGDKNFYNFLLTIGLTPNKTKTISKIKIPSKYFFDFLRGHGDGDGSFYSYFDPRWKASFMFYLTFVSASKKHIDWLRDEIFKGLKVHGHVTKGKNDSIYQLKYAKAGVLKLYGKMYYNKNLICLSRKRKKIEEAIKLDSQIKTKRAGGEIGKLASLRG